MALTLLKFCFFRLKKRQCPLNVVITPHLATKSSGLGAFTQDFLLDQIHIEFAAGEAARRGPFEKGRPFSFVDVTD